MSRLSKILALSILFFIIPVIVSASLLAPGPSLSVLPQYVKLHGSLNNEGSVDGKTLTMGMLVEEDGDPRFFTKELSPAANHGGLSLPNTDCVWAPGAVFTPKVPIQISQSILNL